MGSSVGVSKAHDAAELDAAVALALRYDEWILAEEAIAGREIEVGVLGDDPPEASLPGEIIPGAEFYDYADKYEDGKAKLLAPAPLSDAQTAEVRALAVRAFEACRVRGDGARRLLPPRRPRLRRERAEHDPRLHADLDVPAPVGGLGRPVLRSCSTASSTSRSPATPAAPAEPANSAARAEPREPRSTGDDGAGEGAGDAVDELDLGDDHAAELVDGVGLGPQDHVVGAGHVVGLDDARRGRGTASTTADALPTSVWMRMYALTPIAAS